MISELVLDHYVHILARACRTQRIEDQPCLSIGCSLLLFSTTASPNIISRTKRTETKWTHSLSFRPDGDPRVPRGAWRELECRESVGRRSVAGTRESSHAAPCCMHTSQLTDTVECPSTPNGKRAREVPGASTAERCARRPTPTSTSSPGL